MIIHFLPTGEMLTSCGLSTAGREPVPVTTKKRDVNCQLCKINNYQKYENEEN